MNLFATIVVGLIAGFLASKIMKTNTSIWVELILGVVGSIVGGLIGSLFGLDLMTGINLTSILLALAGAIIVIVIYRFIKRRK
ncbi:MAG TPA: GlsB/YeaQ/YmgE family stress response membrane protein [Anaerolineaceae bacterium]|jgi:uncharacterized membrane protein YeaQ/YmgE (transglycosylase-associated protein family)|nr:GlsB/YeaQ/YmgE family stress response membrane protein [Longilinea sp.]HNR45805.1 GlsB/YeaQ/YmgE family stress response membrane protein [Anaerolineaceae bacterium]HNS36400.1 GlsB/YeaQ/YmgE family stress response membrane protein [Anaerolineaceae bacterium]HNZ13335.1 GlsB/YeaQ/YmgE family stress response membrane protein [Anaerolineaceae bacterium]HOG79489.1 GlsB/YeaQ/YmgE family stress response membrane protein [Anaerolineaceae bacterium]